LVLAVGILLVVITLLLARSSLRQAVVVAATTTKQTQTSFISVVVLLRVVAQEMITLVKYVRHLILFRETMVVQPLPTLAVVAAVKVQWVATQLAVSVVLVVLDTMCRRLSVAQRSTKRLAVAAAAVRRVAQVAHLLAVLVAFQPTVVLRQRTRVQEEAAQETSGTTVALVVRALSM